MVTVRILGGLGNQLFQYAFGRYLSLKKEEDLMLDYYNQIIRDDFDGENLTKITDVFDLPVKVYVGKRRKNLLCDRNLAFVDRLIMGAWLKTKCVVTEDTYDRLQKEIEKNKNIYLAGYWQSERYFTGVKDIIRSDFKFKIEDQICDLDLYEDICANNSVSLHVRGKDYVNHFLYERCDVKYYLAAIDIISKINSELKFFIFTDDIDNVHENYRELLPFSKIVDVNTPFKSDIVDLLLMSSCKHNVICNSSFSWWGAWLNNNAGKIVVSPKKWFKKNPRYSSKYIVSDGWHKI